MRCPSCDRLRLPTDLDRTVATLSGGEAVLTALAGLIVRRATVSLLDEPTNNLDRPARERLYEAVADWSGVLVVVSHDRELLDHVDQIAELRDGRHAHVRAARSPTTSTHSPSSRSAAERMVRVAETQLRKEKRERIEAETVLARRLRAGNKAEREKRVPKIVAHNRKRAGAGLGGEVPRACTTTASTARAPRWTRAEAAVRDDDLIRIALPGTAVPNGRTVLDLDCAASVASGAAPSGAIFRTTGETAHSRRSGPRPGADRAARPQRVGQDDAAATHRDATGAPVPIGYLPQRLDILDPSRSVLDNVRAVAPEATPHEVRAELARFLLRGDEGRAGRGHAVRRRAVPRDARVPAARRSRRRNCCCWTSRRTTSTWTASRNWSRRCRPTAAR